MFSCNVLRIRYFSFFLLTYSSKSGTASLFSSSSSSLVNLICSGSILQAQFSSVYTQEPDGDAPRMPPRTNVTLEKILVLEKMVSDEIGNTKVNKSCGPNDIHPRILKELVNLIEF